MRLTLKHLRKAAFAAGRIVRDEHHKLYWGVGVGAKTEYKTDETPISRVDRQVNGMMMAFANAHGVGFVGEEGNGAHEMEYVLYVDPIDGTVAFLRGINTATIILTLMHMQDGYGVPVMSVIHEPLNGHTWLVETGESTRYCNHQTGVDVEVRISDSMPDRIKTAVCVFPGASHNLAQVSERVFANNRFDDQQMGAFGVGGGLIASGLIHCTAIARTAAYESAAMSIIVRGAGGVAHTLEGAGLSDRFRFGEVRGKPDFELPDGAVFSANDQVAHTFLDEVRAANQ